MNELIIGVKTVGAKESADQLDKLAKSGEKAEKKTKGVGKGAGQTVAPFKAMRGATQQASFQLQDIAVQAQSGTDAFIIIGQQGPQLASIFGPGGAVFGAVIAFGALIGGVLVKQLGYADTSIEDLETALGRLDKAMESTDNGAFELATRIQQLADVSTSAARAELLSLSVDTQTAFENTGKAIDKFVNQSLNSGLLDGDPQILQNLTHGIEEMRKRGFTEDDIMNMNAMAKGYVGFTTLGNSLSEVSSEFGLSTEQAGRFVEAASQLNDGDYKSYQNFADVVDQIGVETNFADKELKTFRDGLSDQMTVMADSTAKAELLEKALNALNSGDSGALSTLMKGSIAEVDKSIEAERSYIAALNDELSQLTLTGDELLKYNALKAGATAESLESAVALQKEINLIKEKNEAEKEANRLLEAKRKAADKAKIADDKRRDKEESKREEDLEKFVRNETAKKERKKAIAQENLIEIERGLMSERELLASYETEDIARITADRDAKLISLQEFEDAKIGIEEKAAVERTSITQEEERAKNEVRMQSLNALSGFTSQLSQIAEEGSKEAKVLFALQKAIAVAQIIVATEVAANAAGAHDAVLGGLLGWVASSTGIRTMGYASAGMVAGMAIAGRANGGQVMAGESYLVGERGPELLSMGTSGRIATNENLKRAVNSDQESSKTQNVSVNFNIVANDTKGFDALLNSRRGQIVSMINRAVNNSGKAKLT